LASASGINLCGLVDRGRFDAGEPAERRLQNEAPTCGTVVVLASGGRSFAQQFGRWHAEVGRGNTTAAMFALAIATEIATLLQQANVICRVMGFGGRARVHEGRLGEAAGFGVVSPVSGLLLHPEFGPWVRVRAAVLCDGMPFGALPEASLAESFHPCCGCPRPCVTACPATVHDGMGHHDLARCGSHRLGGGCDTGCGSRAACPLGAEHRDDAGESAHRHTYELASLQRWLGRGVWRFVPPRLRGGPLPS
jgi:hypothetical protein